MRSLNYPRLILALVCTGFTGMVLVTATQCVLMVAAPKIAIPPWSLPLFIGICISSVWWLPRLQLLQLNVRLPILEEEKQIGEALDQVRQRSGDPQQYQVWMEEATGPSAVAIGRRTIILSSAALQRFTREELEAVIAHELGHLRSGDTTAACVMYINGWIIHSLLKIYSRVLLGIGRITFKKIGLMGIMIALLFWINADNTLLITGTLLGLFIWLQLQSTLFSFLLLLVSRYSEYRQDAYAQSLGYGLALKKALLKISHSSLPPPVSWWSITFYGTHPVLHHRIRRLEKLEGLRQ